MTTQRCAACGTTAPVHFLACPRCHALFHAEKLSAFAQEATALEAQGDVLGALERLRAMEPLLPSASTQSTQLRARIAALEPRAAGQKGAPSKAPRWLAGLGAVGLAVWKFAAPLLALLSKTKLLFVGLLKLPTLLSFFVSAALWSDGPRGTALAVVVLLSIYVHEVGHTWAFRTYGIAVSPPMFVPGVGAFVRGASYPKSPTAAGDVALSGPLWGGVAGVVVLGAGLVTQEAWLCGAAVLVAEVNLFNLLPVWQLDGARATKCLSPKQLLVVGGVGLLAGALAGSPMALLSSGGLLARRWVYPPEGPGDRRTFVFLLALVLGLSALRFGAHLALGASPAGSGPLVGA
jgi:Zn-dependent protease